MIVLIQFSLQENISPVIELINHFHDYVIISLLGILSFTIYIFLYVTLNPYFDRFSYDSRFLETVWAIAPVLLLFLICFPSLHIVFILEDVLPIPNTFVRVAGDQLFLEKQYPSLLKLFMDGDPTTSSGRNSPGLVGGYLPPLVGGYLPPLIGITDVAFGVTAVNCPNAAPGSLSAHRGTVAYLTGFNNVITVVGISCNDCSLTDRFFAQPHQNDNLLDFFTRRASSPLPAPEILTPPDTPR